MFNNDDFLFHHSLHLAKKNNIYKNRVKIINFIYKNHYILKLYQFN